MNMGKIASSSSEGNNKFFSSKRHIPILKMTSLVINKMPKNNPAIMPQGDEIQIQIRVVYRVIRLNHSLASLNLEADL